MMINDQWQPFLNALFQFLLKDVLYFSNVLSEIMGIQHVLTIKNHEEKGISTSYH